MNGKKYNPTELIAALQRGGVGDLRTACDFADRIVAAVKKANDIEMLSEGTLTYRARIGYVSDEILDDSGGCKVNFYPRAKENMGAPPESKKISLGRFNPPNAPVLYLSTAREVALAEIRALPSDICTVATFQTVKPIKFAKLLQHDKTSIIDIIEHKQSDEILEKWMLSETANFVSRRMPDHERDVHYRACNLIASAFRESGIEGLAYRTSFWSPGWHNTEQSVDENHVLASNIVLFDPDAAAPGLTAMFKINWKRPFAVEY